MNRNLSLCLASVVLTSSLVIVSGDSFADDAVGKAPAQNRAQYRDERPDDSRGWMVMSKESYWPLCYESLDRLNEARALIGKAKPEEMGDALDKCRAWLQMAGSAAMIQEDDLMSEAVTIFRDAAADAHAGSDKWDEAKLKKLIKLGNLVMVRSHNARASLADDTDEPSHVNAKTNDTVPHKEVKQGNIDAAKEKRDLQIAQYRYEMLESKKHLEMAIAYLEAAAVGDKSATEVVTKLPEIPAKASASDLLDYNDEQIRTRIDTIRAYVTAEGNKLVAELE